MARTMLDSPHPDTRDMALPTPPCATGNGSGAVIVTLGEIPDLAAVAEGGMGIGAEYREATSYDQVVRAITPYIDDPRCAWFVARRGSEVVGSLLAQIKEAPFIKRRDAFVDVVGVRPDCRGGGVASALIKAVEQWAFERCAAGLVLELPAQAKMRPPEGYEAVEVWYRKDLSQRWKGAP